ncbi:exodeoxyribonuclease VII small subunit [Candidatus Saccharibacteria bacterium]|nr:MAG: exodeoxyribonuclease VII small subunit [Candidatus Saccharibacteria bacterium]
MSNNFMQFDYAAKTAELEDILAHLQAEDIQLDEALKLHAAGKLLIADIEDYLKQAENEVTKQLAKGA